jgi:hypothetical protein
MQKAQSRKLIGALQIPCAFIQAMVAIFPVGCLGSEIKFRNKVAWTGS